MKTRLAVLLIIVLHLCWFIETVSIASNKNNDEQVQEKTCSRKNSKYVREFFARVLLPIYKKYELPMPLECEFSPLNDIYYYQENNKTKIEQTKWKCELCGKIFINENYLDRHFTNKHNDTLHKAPNGSNICLAHLCPLFRCDVSVKKKSACDDNQMKTLKERCGVMLQTCIPKNSNADKLLVNKLSVELNDKLCNLLDCSRYEELPSFMTEGPNFLSILIIVTVIGLSLIGYAVLNHTDLAFHEKEPTSSAIEELVDVNKIVLSSKTNGKLNNKVRIIENHYPIGILNNHQSSKTTNNEIRQRKTVTFRE